MLVRYLLAKQNNYVCKAALSTSAGYDFYSSIGKPRYISAPMVEQSALSWRLLTRSHGCDLAFTEMLVSGTLVRSQSYRSKHFDWQEYKSHDDSINCHFDPKVMDRPIIAQLCGHDANKLVEAGRYLQNDVQAIDLNLGCPQGCARKGKYGAYLLPFKDDIVKLVTAMVVGLECPVTVKIRRLESEEETLELCAALEKCGISMLTIHGRTVSQCNQFSGPADWDIIRKVKSTVSSIPVIANGGISSRQDADDCMAVTGADGVMSSEALLEYPDLFSADQSHHRNNFVQCQLGLAKELLYLEKKFNRPLTSNNKQYYSHARSHLFKMLHRFLRMPTHFDLRDQLASPRCTYDSMLQVVQSLDDRLQAVGYDEALAVQQSVLASKEQSWYLRYRNKYI